MNPVVVMAMYGRRDLVEINLRMLSCQVVVCCSTDEDYQFLRWLGLPNLKIVSTMNYPLGRKWQDGVNAARDLGADPLIILGSDDFLSTGFAEKASELSKKHDFTFFDEWFMYDQFTGRAYKCYYNMMKFNKPPLGSGRIFSKKFLIKHDWKVFDGSLNIKLDDFAYDRMNSDDEVCLNPPGLHVLAVKGRHDSMNPLERILRAETINWEYTDRLDSYFNFKKPIKTIFPCVA
jgi:hypothetical protein